MASSSDRTGGESSDPTDGIINFVTDSEDERAFSSPSPAPTQSDAGFQVDIPRGVANSKLNASNKHIIHAQIEERNERKGKRTGFMSYDIVTQMCILTLKKLNKTNLQNAISFQIQVAKICR